MDRKEAGNYQVEDFITDESFINYYFQLDAKDILYWEQWLEKHPQHAGIIAEASEMMEMLSLKLPESEYRQELERVKKAVNYQEIAQDKDRSNRLFRVPTQAHVSPTLHPKRKRRWMIFIPIVALLIAAIYLLDFFTPGSDGFAQKFNNSSVPVVFTLNDGTVVTLAPQSTLRYFKRFEKGIRKVYLEGEAQFHVKRDIAHPFKVYSGELVATVLGTVFKIQKQQGDSVIQVELLTGRLQVETSEAGTVGALPPVILNPEERVLYNRFNKKLTKETWQAKKETVVVANHVRFNKDNFEAIAEKLKQVFGVTVINQSSKKDWQFTGAFDNTTAKDIIENICIIRKLDYQVKADSIFIR